MVGRRKGGVLSLSIQIKQKDFYIPVEPEFASRQENCTTHELSAFTGRVTATRMIMRRSHRASSSGLPCGALDVSIAQVAVLIYNRGRWGGGREGEGKCFFRRRGVVKFNPLREKKAFVFRSVCGTDLVVLAYIFLQIAFSRTNRSKTIRCCLASSGRALPPAEKNSIKKHDGRNSVTASSISL